MRLTVPPLTWLASFGCIIRAVVGEIVAFELRPQYAWSHHSEIELQSAADFVSQSVISCEFRISSLPKFDLHCAHHYHNGRAHANTRGSR